MTDRPARPASPRRPRGPLSVPLAVTLLVAALAAFGCSDDPEPQTREGLGHVRSTLGAPPTSDQSSLFDVDLPTVANLDPELLEAVESAARDAHGDGVALEITSGWRSREHQQRLYDEAVAKYGSEEEARRYVSTPDTSAHVTGDAVDIGPTDADDWLGRHGAAYGLCQVFANEIWHFELATDPGGECPEMLPDSSYRG